MTRYLKIFTITLLICSCNNLKGRIEKRDNGCDGVSNSKKVFLVNDSKTELCQFTVKYIETINDKNNEYSTQLITLQPGDEKYLGCDISYSEQKYLSTKKIQLMEIDNVKMYAYNSGSFSEVAGLFSKNDLKDKIKRTQRQKLQK